MAGSINKVMLLGRVGRDPEMRSTNNGNRIATFSMATSDVWRDRDSGDKKERTAWHNIVVFNERLAEIIEKYVHKGSLIYVEGALQTRKWQDQQGQDRYTTEVVLSQYRGEIQLLGDSRGNRPPAADDQDSYGNVASRETGSYAARHGNPESVGGRRSTKDEFEDEIPF